MTANNNNTINTSNRLDTDRGRISEASKMYADQLIKVLYEGTPIFTKYDDLKILKFERDIEVLSTNGNKGKIVGTQTDGALVLYEGTNTPIFTRYENLKISKFEKDMKVSNIDGDEGKIVEIQDDGALILYKSGDLDKTNESIRKKLDNVNRLIGKCIDSKINIFGIKDKIIAEETRLKRNLYGEAFLDFVEKEIKKIATDNKVNIIRPIDMSTEDLVNQRDQLLDVTAKLGSTPRFNFNYRGGVLRNLNKMRPLKDDDSDPQSQKSRSDSKDISYPENVLNFVTSIPSMFGHRKSKINRGVRTYMKNKNILRQGIEHKNIKKKIEKFLLVAQPRDTDSPETQARKQAVIIMVRNAYQYYIKQNGPQFDEALSSSSKLAA